MEDKQKQKESLQEMFKEKLDKAGALAIEFQEKLMGMGVKSNIDLLVFGTDLAAQMTSMGVYERLGFAEAAKACALSGLSFSGMTGEEKLASFKNG